MNSQNWLEIFNKFNTQEIVSGKVIRKVKGAGIIVDVFGVEGFLPWSQVPQNLKNKEDDIVDADINFKILKINTIANNIVVSRINMQSPKKQNACKNIHVGDIYDAIVKNVVDYGVFVTIHNNITGLIHIKDLSWKYISDVNQYVRVSETIKVKVKSIEIDEDNYKISFSHKECIPSPWETIDTKVYYKNALIDVVVQKSTPRGLIVSAENDCQGFLPLTQESNVETKFDIGDKLAVRIQKIDIKKHELYVSLK